MLRPKQLVLSVLFLLLTTTFVQAFDKKNSKKEQLIQNKIQLCSACHGLDGNSVDARWPSIAGLNENYLKKQLIDFKEGHRKNEEMAELIQSISNETLDDLASYFSSQKLTLIVSTEKENNERENLKLGEEIYNGKRIDYGIPGCLHCHGKDAMGDKEGKYPRLVGQYKEYLIKQMQLFRAKERSNDVPSMMRNTAMMMDDEDIESVAAYIRSLSLENH